ncbi:HAMP domain-containing protein, partial [Candidatus Bipolaricaulota bacterium]|nr:HAMP domain-containing protein [Candidatus Bipolaricaulota bacterium]
MINNLRVKLLGSFFLVVAIAVGTIAYIASMAAVTQFDRYVSQDQAERYQRLALTYTNYFRYSGDWTEVNTLTEKVAEMYSERVVLTDPNGIVISDTAEELVGREISENWSNKKIKLSQGEYPIGRMYIKTQERSELQNAFLSSVNKSVITAAIIAGIAGIVLAAFLSRNIVNPVLNLTRATKKMQEGELDQRVEITTNDEIGALSRAFNSLANRLKQQKQLREEMVSDVAHELRNPLSNIQGYLEGLKEGMVEPTEEVFQSLHQQSLVLNRLINDLRDVNQAKVGKLDLEKKQIVLEDVASNAIKAVENKALEKEVTINSHLPDSTLITADPERISQVIRNLLDNALTHTRPGGKITISVRPEGEVVVLHVIDT